MSVRYDRQQRTAMITLERPEVLNALDPQMYQELNAALAEFDADERVWVGILTGAGPAFCAGGDIDCAAKLTDGLGVSETYAFYDLQLTERVAGKPMIAAVNGACVGDGVNIALACDIRIAAESATFSMGGVRMGMPSVYGALRCPQIMGLGHALEFLLFGETKDSAWAHRTGLANLVVSDEALLEAALSWADRLAQGGPIAVRQTRELSIRQNELSFAEMRQLGRSFQADALRSSDVREGLSAFNERRKPQFTGT